MRRILSALVASAALSAAALPAASVEARAATSPGGGNRGMAGRVTYLVPPRNRALVDGVVSGDGDGNGRVVAAWSTGKEISVRWRGRHERWSKTARFQAGEGLQQQQVTFIAGGSPMVVWTTQHFTATCQQTGHCPVYLRYSTHTARGWSLPPAFQLEGGARDTFDMISNPAGDVALVSAEGVNFYNGRRWGGVVPKTGYGESLSGASVLDSRGRAVVVRWAWNGGQKFLQVEQVFSNSESRAWPFPTNRAVLLGLPTLGADKTGDVDLVWRTWGASGVTVWTSTLSDTGHLSAPTRVLAYPSSQASASAAGTCTALAGDGRAVFAWPSGHGAHGVHAVYRNADGHLGRVTSFAGRDPGCSSVTFPKSGGAWMMFHTDVCPRGRPCFVRHRVVRHPATGTWATPRTVATRGLKPTGTVLTVPAGHLTFPLFRRGSYFALLTASVPR